MLPPWIHTLCCLRERLQRLVGRLRRECRRRSRTLSAVVPPRQFHTSGSTSTSGRSAVDRAPRSAASPARCSSPCRAIELVWTTVIFMAGSLCMTLFLHRPHQADRALDQDHDQRRQHDQHHGYGRDERVGPLMHITIDLDRQRGQAEGRRRTARSPPRRTTG